MAIVITGAERVLVQGITGREGRTRTRLMRQYGTRIVAGVTPGKGGQAVDGVPVFDSVLEAQGAVGTIDISVLFVPAPLVRAAALEAIAAGVGLLIIVPDRVPIHDVLDLVAAADDAGTAFIGPNTLGVLSPDRGVLGMMGGRAESARDWFLPGEVGITSRSGGVTTSLAYYLARAGIGASTLVHVGGDAVVGLPQAQVVARFERDPDTRAVVLYGEIGTSQEEQVAELIDAGGFTKPLIALIGGRAAQGGTRFSHAGAIVEGGRGGHEAKVERLRSAGAHIATSLSDLPQLVAEVLRDVGGAP
jgi:succinyl-CoA synthetase alpha subunit